MKIVFMTSGTVKSSISYRPLAIARELVKKGHDTYIFAPRFDKYSNYTDERIAKISAVSIVRPIQINFFGFEISLLSYIISSLYLLLRLQPDVVHINKPNPITITGLVVKLFGKSVVVDVDDLDSEVIKIEMGSKARVILVQLSDYMTTQFADAIIVASKFLKTLYSSKNKNKKVSYIPNGAEFEHPEKLINVKSMSVNRIVFIGNINRKSILSPLFYAIEKLKHQDIRLQVVIIGDGNYLSYFKKLAKNLGIAKDVEFVGRIPRKKLGKYVKVGDIGYSYMPNEITVKACSSMKVFQYMQFGVVPLVSNVGDFPLYVFRGKAGYIAKHSNINALADELRKAIADRTGRKNKINFALTNAPKVYKWQVLADKTERAYLQTI